MRPLATRPRPALNPLALLALLLAAAGCAVDRAGAAVEALEAEPVVLSHDADDAVLDRLRDECAAAVEGACDELYWSSPVGSSYERFSASR